jgi:chromosome segregation ATPase
MGWNPSKKRSEGRLSQLQAINARKSAAHQEKENRPITTQSISVLPTPPPALTAHISNAVINSEDRALASQLRAEHFQRQLHNERRKSARAKRKLDELQEEVHDCQSRITVLEGNARMLDIKLLQELAHSRAALSKSEAMISKTKHPLSQAQARITTLTKTRDRLVKRVARLPGKVKSVLEKPHALKEKGIFTEQARTMTRELVKAGVPMEQVGSAVKAVAQGFGVNIKGNISARSVGRITLEGGIAAQLQLVHEIQHAPGKLVLKFRLTYSNSIISTNTQRRWDYPQEHQL